MVFWFFTGLFLSVFIIHMIRPRFQRRRISSLQFFAGLPPARTGPSRFRMGNPFRSRPLYLQLLILATLLYALYQADKTYSAPAELGFGVWIAVDTSASMSTLEAGQTRLELARREALAILQRVDASRGGLDLCVKISGFHMGWDHQGSMAQMGAARAALGNLQVRPLGTNLNLIRRLFGELERQNPESCRVTQLVVLSDQPAPTWSVRQPGLEMVWRQVGGPVENLGFTAVTPVRDPLTGLVKHLEFGITNYGNPGTLVKLSVKDEQGDVVFEASRALGAEETWPCAWLQPLPGRYTAVIEPGGAYGYDDQVSFPIGDHESIRVDWHLPDKALLQQLGWAEDNTDPHLRVRAPPFDSLPSPTLYVSQSGSGNASTEKHEIRDFYEASPLLADLNLDVGESLGWSGTALPQGFQAVLRRMDGSVLLAQRESPPAVLVPMLPGETQSSEGKFAATSFFNGVRWLLENRPLEPLTTLTDMRHPEPQGNRLVLHENEGNTRLPQRSFGRVETIQPVRQVPSEFPLWPLLLTLAVVFMVMDRLLAFYKGGHGVRVPPLCPLVSAHCGACGPGSNPVVSPGAQQPRPPTGSANFNQNRFGIFLVAGFLPRGFGGICPPLRLPDGRYSMASGAVAGRV